jgi:phosphoribosylaminoimidazole-succinocarboxamide synthase
MPDLHPPFDQVDLPLPDRRDGKVRVSYALADDRRLFVTTDRLSAFDRIIASVPYKGQVLNQLSWWWFQQTADVVPNHALTLPDPNALVARAVEILPVEVVVRRRLTGVTSTSVWKRYEAGARVIDGYRLPEGLREHDALPEPIITPTTKALHGGHDEPLSCDEVVKRGLVTPARWDEVCSVARALFARGEAVGERAGLVLADTKYEMGVDHDGVLYLADEVHTPDSSRWWIASTIEERLSTGRAPESLDKEPVRRALADAGFRGDGPLPQLPHEVWEETSGRYVEAYVRLTGSAFVPGEYPVPPRLAANIDRWLQTQRQEHSP